MYCYYCYDCCYRSYDTGTTTPYCDHFRDHFCD